MARRKKKGSFLVLLFIMCCISALIGGGAAVYQNSQKQQEFDVVTFKKLKEMAAVSEEYIITKTEVTMTAVGDIMVHKAQLERAYVPESDTFDFGPTFAYVAEILGEKDYTLGNLETTIAGRNKGNNPVFHGYSDYPCFNSPENLVDTLKEIGVDFLGTSNNHSLDSGKSGVFATLDYLDTLGFSYTGTARSQEEKDSLCIVEVNGIKFGFSAYTYATNGIPIPSSAPFAVNTLEEYIPSRTKEMCNQVTALKEAGADFVIAIPHWGYEYKTVPSSYQEELADDLFEAGADVIFGSHPHVVQPMEVRTITNPDGTTRTGVCIYSLGNFISSQTNMAGPDKDLGLIMNVTFGKEGDVCTIDAVEVTSTYAYWTDDVIGVVPVEYALANKGEYPLIDDKGWSRIQYAHEKIIQVVAGKYDVDYIFSDKWYQIQLP